MAQPHFFHAKPLDLPAKSAPNEAWQSEVGLVILSLVFYTYILKLSGNTYYTGYSSDLKQRIAAHHNGLVPQTKNLRPLTLIYYSAFTTKKKALDFEAYLKTYSGFAFRNKHLL